VEKLVFGNVSESGSEEATNENNRFVFSGTELEPIDNEVVPPVTVLIVIEEANLFKLLTLCKTGIAQSV